MAENDALELEILEQTPTRLSFNVTRCRYAEMYRALGLPDLGGSLSCQRDYALAQGFNPAIELTRTQTIMEGAPFCDFRFRLAGIETRPDRGTDPTDEREDTGASEPGPPLVIRASPGLDDPRVPRIVRVVTAWPPIEKRQGGPSRYIPVLF